MAAQPQRKLLVFVGGSSGVGFTALESILASGEAYNVVLGSRQPLEGWRYGQISSSLQSSNSTFDRYQLDLSHYDSVRRFVEVVTSAHPQPIDALVLCAGKVSGKYHRTADGEEETLQVNALSHALLIDLFEPKLGAGGIPSRVLIVSSGLHRSVPERTVTPVNLDSHLTVQFDPMAVYHITKLIGVFLLYIAQERFDQEKKPVTVVAVSPGFIPDTGLSRELSVLKRGITQWLLPHTPVATTMPDGGRTISRGVTQHFNGGTYFSQRKVEETAEETYDPQLREAWKTYLIAKRVWHSAAPATATQPPAVAPTATATAAPSAPAPAPAPAPIPSQTPAAPQPANAVAAPEPAQPPAQ